MCGRYTLTHPGTQVATTFGLACVPDLGPRYNIAPTQTIPVVRATTEGRELVFLRWGLVPSWATSLTSGPLLINARSETAASKPTFRTALSRRRCLIPACGFYEWLATGGKKQPVHFRLRQGDLFAIAGLWERWQPPGGGPAVESCAILTTQANEVVQPVHDRMPAVLTGEAVAAWLEGGREGKELAASLGPLPAERLIAVPVSRRVSSPHNEGPDCLQLA